MQELTETQTAEDPFVQFNSWYQDACNADLLEPEAMTLATATPDGRPSARMVLLKGVDERGFVFYTNYESRKGEELRANPYAALIFFWVSLQRQIRIEGHVEMISDEESDAYFQRRNPGHRIAACASQQSKVLENRDELERRVAELTKQYRDGNVPRPPYWGGYRVCPTSIEFWQGRPNRLHDRLVYHRLDDGTWVTRRLFP